MIHAPRLEVVLNNRPLLSKLGLLEIVGDNTLLLPYKTTLSAAFDLFAVIEKELVMYPSSIQDIPTGLSFHAIGFPFDVGIRLFIRSGVSRFLSLANSVGLIDPDYQGQLMLRVRNHGLDTYIIEPGERIAQAEFYPVLRIEKACLVEKFSQETERGVGGFGHTGKFQKDKM